MGNKQSDMLYSCVVAEIIIPSEVHVYTEVASDGFHTELKASIHPDSILYAYYMKIYNQLLNDLYDMNHKKFESDSKLREQIRKLDLNLGKPIILYIGDFKSVSKEFNIAIITSYINSYINEYLHPTNNRFRHIGLDTYLFTKNLLVCSMSFSDVLDPEIDYQKIITYYLSDMSLCIYKNIIHMRKISSLGKTYPFRLFYHFTDSLIYIKLTKKQDVLVKYDESAKINGCWILGESDEQKYANTWIENKKRILSEFGRPLHELIIIRCFTESDSITPGSQRKYFESIITDPELTPCPEDDSITLYKKLYPPMYKPEDDASASGFT